MQGSTYVKKIIIVVFQFCTIAFVSIFFSTSANLHAANRSQNVSVHMLKVLNNKVAEEMDIVENHLTALTSTYCFNHSGRSFGRYVQRRKLCYTWLFCFVISQSS